MITAEGPKRHLLEGVEILNGVLSSHGFVFQLGACDKGSGGWFASGSYRRGERELELHFRGSLGLVTYHIGDDSLDHETYMRFVGAYGQNQYPGFPKEPIESFMHLASDISNYCTDFVSGDGSQFRAWAQEIRQNPMKFKGIGAIG